MTATTTSSKATTTVSFILVGFTSDEYMTMDLFFANVTNLGLVIAELDQSSFNVRRTYSMLGL